MSKLEETYAKLIASSTVQPGSTKRKSPWRRYLFHVTTLPNLRSIARRGLGKGYLPTFGNYESHSRGRIFLTEKDSADCWHGKVSDIVEYGDMEIEDVKRRKLVPVLLRIDRKRLDDDLKLYVDRLGSDDCRDGKSFYVKRKIPANAIDVWIGSGYQPVSDFHYGVGRWSEAKATFGKYAHFKKEGPKDDRYLTVKFDLPAGY